MRITPTYLPTLLPALLLALLLSVFPSSVLPSASASELHSTLIASPTGLVRYVGYPVGRIVWIDCRAVAPDITTAHVSRVYSGGTDLVASVYCTNGLGRSAPTTNTFYTFLGEYFRVTGTTTCTVRVVTAGVP
jgi:hypothetical protein